jgi:hypothetical protein
LGAEERGYVLRLVIDHDHAGIATIVLDTDHHRLRRF